MKQARKEELLRSFPAVPEDLKTYMLNPKSAENFSVFLTNGKELFVRCFHKYSGKKMLIERQRYVFAKDGAVRYGIKYDPRGLTYWEALTRFREPVFCSSYYGRNFNNEYIVLNREAIEKSDMKYACLTASCDLPIEYLRLYCQHPNVEYLMKAGYEHLITEKYFGYWGQNAKLHVYNNINWKSNNLLKMLHLNKTEFKLLQGREELYEPYIWWRNDYPKESPEHLIAAAERIGGYMGTTDELVKLTGYKIFRIVRYLEEQNIDLILYHDYIRQCQKLQYNLHDTAICFPKSFTKMHNRLTDIISALEKQKYRQQNKEKGKEIAKQMRKARKYRQQMEFEYNDLILRQPESPNEIIEEGKELQHCVGGFVERHLKAQTNIFFIRKKSEPNKPYFTIEVTNSFEIRQCHGYKNDVNGKPDEIKEFEAKYKKYLKGLKNGNNSTDRTA